MNTVLLIDNNYKERQELKCFLSDVLVNSDIKEAIDLTQAQVILNQIKVDLILIDVNFPDSSVINFIPEVKKYSPNVCIVVITTCDNDSYVFQALNSGANGYFIKMKSRILFLIQLQRVLKKSPFLSASVSKSILQYLNKPKPKSNFSPSSEIKDINLTERETEVLILITKGCLRKEIANLLSISTNTVSSYIKIIYRKMGVNNSAQATFEAMKIGLVTAPAKFD